MYHDRTDRSLLFSDDTEKADVQPCLQRAAVRNGDFLDTAVAESHRNWKLGLAGLSAIGVSYGFARYGYGLFLPDIRREYDLSVAVLGVIASAGYVGYLVALTIVGIAASSVGPRPLVVTGALSAGVGMAIVAVAPGPILLVVGITLAGASSGWAWAPFSDAVDRMVSQKSRERLLSVISTGTAFGVIVAAPAALLAGDETWRYVWLGFATVALAVAVYNFTVLPRGPHGTTRRSFLRDHGVRWFARTSAAPLYLTAFSFGLLGSVFWSFAVEMISQARGSDASTGPLFWSLIGLAGIAGVLTGDAVGLLGLSRTHLIITGSLAVAIGLLGAAPGWLPAIATSGLLYGASFMGMAALLAIWSSKVFPEQPSTGFSATVFLLGIGSIVGPVTLGTFAEHYGLPRTFLLAGGIAALTLFARPYAPTIAKIGPPSQSSSTAKDQRRPREHRQANTEIPTPGITLPVGQHRVAGDLNQDDNGYRYAGVHLLIDLWGGRGLNDPDIVKHTIQRAVSACGATLLDLRLHPFAPTGITAVALLSESHMTFHSWPDEGYAAIDIFTCGDADPRLVVPVLREEFSPERLRVIEHKRGYCILPTMEGG